MKKSKKMQLGVLLAAMLLLSMVFVPVVSAWAANPTSWGTHWYMDSYGFIGSVTYSPDQTSLFSEAYGNYHNWDFDDINQATYADHWSKIQGKNDGDFDYWWSATHSGEYWWLLDGDVYTY